MPPLEEPTPPLYARDEELDNEEDELKNKQDWEAHDLLMDERNRYFALSNMSKEVSFQLIRIKHGIHFPQ